MTDIKPCPFCGSNYIVSDHLGNKTGVLCINCHAHLYVIGGKTKAITAWNTRAEKEVEKPMPEIKTKTMMEDFFEKFPNAPKDEKGCPIPCPEDVYNVTEYLECNYNDEIHNCLACWSRPIPPQTEAYRNATVLVEYKDGEPVVSWVRQDDTEQITEKEALDAVKVRAKHE